MSELASPLVPLLQKPDCPVPDKLIIVSILDRQAAAGYLTTAEYAILQQTKAALSRRLNAPRGT